jgi:hypothetical protein
MRTYAIAVLVAGLMLSSAVLPDAAQAQSNPAQPPAGAVETAPIGKVITATGSVTIERASAVVVQANVPGNGGVGQTKVGDPVYKGDVVQTGADAKVGITFTDGTAFNLSSNARMVLNEFVYDPNGTSNSTLFSLTKGTFTFVAGQVAKTGDRVMQKRGNIEENKRAVAVKRQAKRTEDNLDKNVDIKIKSVKSP